MTLIEKKPKLISLALRNVNYESLPAEKDF